MNSHSLSLRKLLRGSIAQGDKSSSGRDGLHVLFLPSWYPSTPQDIGGSFFREQAIALSSAGMNVGVVAVDLRSPRQWRVLFTGPRSIRRESDCGVETVRFHGVNWWTRMPRALARRWLRYARACVDNYIALHGRPDILHAHSLLYGGVLARQVGSELGIPFVVTEHSSAYAHRLHAPWQLELAADAARHAHTRFAVSPALARMLDESLRQPGPWEFLPNMVHRQFLEAPLSASPRRRAPFVFLTLSGLVPLKNVDGTLKAFHLVLQRDSGVVLRIGGEGPERPRLEEMARELGIAEHVNFLGKVERDCVPAVMAAADAYVLASHYETFGVALIEALAMGLPAVATRCGGPESILSERQGILVPTGDVDALAEGMLRLLGSQENFDHAHIRLECRARFGEEAVVNLLSHGYQKTLHGND